MPGPKDFPSRTLHCTAMIVMSRAGAKVPAVDSLFVTVQCRWKYSRQPFNTKKWEKQPQQMSSLASLTSEQFVDPHETVQR